jgi:hypothetical protein
LHIWFAQQHNTCFLLHSVAWVGSVETFLTLAENNQGFFDPKLFAWSFLPPHTLWWHLESPLQSHLCSNQHMHRRLPANLFVHLHSASEHKALGWRSVLQLIPHSRI